MSKISILNIIKKSILLFTIPLLLTNCIKDADEKKISITDKQQLNLKPYADQEAGSFTLTAQATWTASIVDTKTNNSPIWLGIDKLSGEPGTSVINISVRPNLTGNDRSATLSFLCEEDIISLTITQAGKKKDGSVPDPDDYKSHRAILVYMIASNLGGNLKNNINDMIATATKENVNGGRLVVFYSENKESAELFEIKEGDDGVVSRHHIKNYENMSAVSPVTMKKVIEEFVSIYPAESYGMLLSSHGTAWMPGGYSSMLRSFGEESGKVMEVNILAEGIPDNLFEFLGFDACSMASIECVYELKNKADRIIASASETLVQGFPYRTILPYLFTINKADLGKMAEGFYNFYNTGGGSFGNISITHTQELDNLKNITKEILSTAGMEGIYSLKYSELQILSNFSKSPTPLYDFAQIISKLATEEQYNRFTACLDKTVTDRYYTSQVYCTQGGYSVVNHFSGLSFYPYKESLTQLNEWYKNNLQWAKAVYP